MKDESHRTTVIERIADLMAEGGEWTMRQIADELHASHGGVCTALHELERRGQVRFAGYTRAHGREVRLFRYRPDPDEAMRAELETTRQWPNADPVITAAFDAIARQR